MNSQTVLNQDNSYNQNLKPSSKTDKTTKGIKLSQNALKAVKTFLIKTAGLFADQFLLRLENDREFNRLVKKNPRILTLLQKALKTNFIRAARETIDQNPSLFNQAAQETITKFEEKLQEKTRILKKTRNELKKAQNKTKRVENELNEKELENSRLRVELENLKNQLKKISDEKNTLIQLSQHLQEELILAEAKLNLDSTNCGIPGSMDFGKVKRNSAFDFNRQEEKKNDSAGLNKDTKTSSEKASEKKEDKKENRKKPVPNTREKTARRPGGQIGHPGKTLSMEDIHNLLKNGARRKIVKIGKVDENNCKKGYTVDLDFEVVVTEYQIPMDEPMPEELSGGPVYGSNIRSLGILLNTEGLMGYDRAASIINQLSGNLLNVSEGVLYKYSNDFAKKAQPYCQRLYDSLKSAGHMGTDLTHFDVGKSRCYVRNHSTPDMVAYTAVDSKKVEDLLKDPILKDFNHVLLHDHETSHYHIDCTHAECNIHLIRRLRKLKLIVEHSWIDKMIDLFRKYDHKRNLLIKEGKKEFSSEEIDKFNETFDEIIELANQENDAETRKTIKSKERTLINSITKYRTEHTRFLYDFYLDFTNNISERDLRVVVRKRKMIGCFRNHQGLQKYCEILSIVETAKKQNIPVLEAVNQVLSETSSFWSLSREVQ